MSHARENSHLRENSSSQTRVVMPRGILCAWVFLAGGGLPKRAEFGYFFGLLMNLCCKRKNQNISYGPAPLGFSQNFQGIISSPEHLGGGWLVW